MSRASDDLENAHCTGVEAIRQAVDHTYRHILESAKADWQRLFARRDPADAAVSVRISAEQIAEELAGAPRAGFGQRRRKPSNGKLRRGVA